MSTQKKDIRGKKFRVVEQDFEYVQAGHKPYQKIILLIVGVFLAGTSSALSYNAAEGFTRLLIKPFFDNEFELIVSCLELTTFITTLVLTTLCGLELKFVLYLIILLVIVSGLTTIFPESQQLWLSIIRLGLSTILTWSGCIVTATVVAFASTACGQIGRFSVIVTTSLMLITMSVYSDLPDANSKALALLLGLAVVFNALIIYAKAVSGASEFKWIADKALFWSSIGATSLRGLNLTDVCFDNSDLSYVDFREANLTRTSFKNVKGLKFARLQGTILENPKIRKLVSNPNIGFGEDFTDANMKGANLRKADLREAILVRAQLLDADLSYANLTDACIQDWNINHNTRFTGVECKRIYLKRSPSGHFLEPKPDSGEFLPGEFEKWVTDIRDTIDLIFQNGLNWRAFAFSLTQTAIDHNGLDLAVRSIENKGDGVVVAKVGVSLETNKTAIHQQMSGHYQEAVTAIESGYELALRAKDEEIDRLTQFYDKQQQFIQGLVTGIAETKGQVLIQGEGNRVYLMDQAGDIMESSNQNVNAGGNVDLSSGGRVSIGGDMSGSTVNLGELSGQVSSTIQQLHDIKTGDAQELAQILGRLQQAIESDIALTPDQKQQALEAVSTLAEEGNKPPEQRTAKFCTMAVNALKGLTSTLTDASKLAEVVKMLLPTLTGLFGL